MKKGQTTEMGIVIVGFMIFVIILIAHTIPWIADDWKINSGMDILVELNDNTGKMLPVLKSKTSGYSFADIMACRISLGDSCPLQDDDIGDVAGKMDTALSIHKGSEKVKTYGQEKKRGTVLYADMPVPNGGVESVGVTLDIIGIEGFQSLVNSGEYGNCMEDEDYARKYLTRIDFMEKNVLVNVAAERDFLAVVEDIKKCKDANGYDFWADTAGGTYVCRYNVNNPTELSMHAYGLAIDINPSSNPNCPKDASCSGQTKCITDIPKCVVDAFKNHNFIWGCDYRFVKDSMHFEWQKPQSGGSETVKSAIGKIEDQNSKVTD